MCWVYILENEITGKYYIGSTNDLNRRIKQHLNGVTRTTRMLKTDKIAYTETYSVISEARKREKQLKSYKSHKYIRWLIENKPGR